MGDIHKGNIGCDWDRFLKQRDWIANTDNVLVIGMGDMADCIVPSDRKRFDPRTIEPQFLNRIHDLAMAQKEVLVKELMPIKDKIIGYHRGNHEDEILKRHHVDLTREICRDLDVKNLGYEAFIRLGFEHRAGGARRSFTIHSEHGHGGGRKAGTKLNRVDDRDGGYDADIFLFAHTHTKAVDIKHKMYLDPQGKIQIRKVVKCLTGGFLKKHSDIGEPEPYDCHPVGYAEKAGYNPTAEGVVRIDLSMSDGDIHIRL